MPSHHPRWLGSRTGGRRYHSASLNVGSPSEMAAEWFYDRHPPLREHRWQGTTVAFVGRSSYSIADIALDHAAQAFLAARAGCLPVELLGATVELCVVGVVEQRTGVAGSDRGQLQEAERRGIPRLAEDDFWDALGYDLDRDSSG